MIAALSSAPTDLPVRGDAHALLVEDLGVQYDLRFNRKTPIRQSLSAAVARRPSARFWALRHISLRLEHGESLAVIGPNGAGKSTLLQVLGGIIRPSEGRVDARGRVSGLLTLDVGFDRQLTGRENARLGCAFLGLEDTVTRQIMPSILEFAGLGDFIDAPLKTYSAGMRARLGFAIATSVDPDILLLDEVLATGDAIFRRKSKARVLELVRGAKAVVLVTHDMNWVTEFCDRAVLIEKGTLIMDGAPRAVVDLHQERTSEAHARAEEAAVAAGADAKALTAR